MMKSLIKKVSIVLVVLASVVDWPVKTDAVNAKPLVKASAPLLRSCAKSTKKAEKAVNKVTQETKDFVNDAAENPNALRYGAFAGSRALQNSARGNAQSISQPRMILCPQCYGKGSVQGYDGYVYSCSKCNGSGKIFIK